jgi:hypothetical protein
VEALRLVMEHLLGINRLDFRRLFRATSTGRRSWELDQLGVKPKSIFCEIGDGQPGYWLPEWTWPIVVDALRKDHIHNVVEGKDTLIDKNFVPPGSMRPLLEDLWALADKVRERRNENIDSSSLNQG